MGKGKDHYFIILEGKVKVVISANRKMVSLRKKRYKTLMLDRSESNIVLNETQVSHLHKVRPNRS